VNGELELGFWMPECSGVKKLLYRPLIARDESEASIQGVNRQRT
jgi:hypothetical protein